jgi:cytoskeletal protein RodZ
MPTDQTTCSDLASLRRAKAIPLEDIQRSTRIARHFLEAIEAEDFKNLPGGVYNVSYLRQYARASGCDEAALLNRYREQMEPKQTLEPAPRHPLSRWFREYEPLRNLFGHLAERHAHRDHA